MLIRDFSRHSSRERATFRTRRRDGRGSRDRGVTGARGYDQKGMRGGEGGSADVDGVLIKTSRVLINVKT